MWYQCAKAWAVCYATSNDGLSWHRPLLELYPYCYKGQTCEPPHGARKTNIVWSNSYGLSDTGNGK